MYRWTPERASVPVIKLKAMFALSRGELTIVAFIFALVWSAGALPRLAADLAGPWARRKAARRHSRARRTREGG